MSIQLELILISPCGEIKEPFLVAKYPVAQRDYHTMYTGGGGNQYDEKRVQKVTWLEAIRFCNRLSTCQHVPRAYSEATGQLMDRDGNPAQDTTAVKGFRLPTLQEWEYAAHGWSERKTGEYFAIQKEHYKVPYLDYPTTERMVELFNNGYSTTDEMVVNTVGLYGLIAYGKEWCAGCDGKANRICSWEEYFTNYDNAIGYQVRDRVCAETEEHAFRVVINQRDFATTRQAS